MSVLVCRLTARAGLSPSWALEETSPLLLINKRSYSPCQSVAFYLICSLMNELVWPQSRKVSSNCSCTVWTLLAVAEVIRGFGDLILWKYMSMWIICSTENTLGDVRSAGSRNVTKLSLSYGFDELLGKISSYNLDPDVNLWVSKRNFGSFLPLDDRFQTQILSSFFQLHLAQIKTSNQDQRWAPKSTTLI